MAARLWRAAGWAAYAHRASLHTVIKLEPFLHLVWDLHVLEEQRKVETQSPELVFDAVPVAPGERGRLRDKRDLVQYLQHNDARVPLAEWGRRQVAGVAPGMVVEDRRRAFRLRAGRWIEQLHVALTARVVAVGEDMAKAMVRAACAEVASGGMQEKCAALQVPPEGLRDADVCRRLERQVLAGDEATRGCSFRPQVGLKSFFAPKKEEGGTSAEGASSSKKARVD